MGYRRLVFCQTRGPRVVIDGNKVKVPEARVLVVNELPSGLAFAGDVDLSRSELLTRIGDDLSVGGYLALEYCEALRSIGRGLCIGTSLYLDDCRALQSIGRGLSVGRVIYASGCRQDLIAKLRRRGLEVIHD